MTTRLNDEGMAYLAGWQAKESGSPRSDALLFDDVANRSAWTQGWDDAAETAQSVGEEAEATDRDSRWTDGGLSIFNVKDDQGRTVRE